MDSRLLSGFIAIGTAVLVLQSAPMSAQDFSLATQPGTAATGDEGMMFDVIAVRPLSITGVQVVFEENPLTNLVEVFTKPGTYVGSEAIPGDWTLVGSGSLAVQATNVLSPVFFLSTPIALPAGGQVGLYIVRDSGLGPNLDLTTGTQSGLVNAVDSNLIIFEGVDVGGTFSGVSDADRVPNVVIHYTLTDLAAPVVKVLARKRIRTTERRVRISGLATDDVGIASVLVRFKRQRGNGSIRTVRRTILADEDGLFQINVRTFDGRNPVRFIAIDTDGKLSNTGRVVLIGNE